METDHLCWGASHCNPVSAFNPRKLEGGVLLMKRTADEAGKVLLRFGVFFNILFHFVMTVRKGWLTTRKDWETIRKDWLTTGKDQ